MDWIWQIGHPIRAELLDVNVNTGSQNIDSETELSVCLGLLQNRVGPTMFNFSDLFYEESF